MIVSSYSEEYKFYIVAGTGVFSSQLVFLLSPSIAGFCFCSSIINFPSAFFTRTLPLAYVVSIEPSAYTVLVVPSGSTRFFQDSFCISFWPLGKRMMVFPASSVWYTVLSGKMNSSDPSDRINFTQPFWYRISDVPSGFFRWTCPL